MPGQALADWNAVQLARTEAALSDWVGVDAPSDLGQAMRYAVQGGGKRLRPLLVLAAREAVAGEGHADFSAALDEAALRGALDEAALRGACAVELIHAYSLVHDDMPCMDNDVLRRGKPTVHVQYGQAGALLAGDALQALAFELLTPERSDIPATVQARLCRLLARAAGAAGMAGGQAIDLASVGQRLDEAQLRHMHQLKTGALLQASVMMGAACGAPAAAALAGLARYGGALGLAFQVVDDILDVTQDSATLGKTAGKDAAHAKPTYVSLLGIEAARQCAQNLHSDALAGLAASGLRDTARLAALADMVLLRSN
ncbi:MAG: polyprenyl synthetase family protein [Giesbergeria sp.]|nr:polyprenyl synthetase family protein [Giesbergeria sp.]MBP6158292.1 polyprenyl synthetase family protein [Giesbergeria sp.]MBP7082254.1 polyprenyl synthetase family protein [Giesbergeria sp.]MBP9783781.1 polyprenyl synthetase family protein [Giesbergeria sp.]MBP9894331.1 polyprenyl synthetase family protein [Giesbergeria sp.]